jgi:hypothetical protein
MWNISLKGHAIALGEKIVLDLPEIDSFRNKGAFTDRPEKK